MSGSLVDGITTGDQIAHNSTGNTLTQGDVYNGSSAVNTLSFNVGYSVVQIAIGITVGLFMGTLLAYPFGKGRKIGPFRKETRSGIFSF